VENGTGPWRNGLAIFQFLSIFEIKSMLFRRPFVDTSPPALLVAVLWFSHCLLRPKSSSVIGTWSSRARVFFTS
jgi:hypothetical protein